jgi:hypothetical protein
MAEAETGQEPKHRGRIQAQGGGTEKSESWAQGTAPTESEMLTKCNDLEAQLNARERQERQQPLADLRRFIQAAARSGGVSAPVSKSFLRRGASDIRIDIEVITGQACVPDPATSRP